MEINHLELSIDALANFVKSGKKLTLSHAAVNAVEKCREFLDDKMNEKGVRYQTNQNKDSQTIKQEQEERYH